MLKSLAKRILKRSKYSVVNTDAQKLLYSNYIKEIVSLNDFNLDGKEFKVNDDNVYNILSGLRGISVSEGLYILRSLNQVKSIAGDVCEFGVADGNTSCLIANTINDSDKKFWLYDSFQGLPKPTSEDALKDDIFNLGTMEAYEGLMSYHEAHVSQKLNSIGFPKNRINIVKGFVDGCISPENLPGKISFAFIDFDFYKPIKDVLNSITSRLSCGSVVIVDDYDFFSDGAKLAVDEYLEENQGAYDFIVPDKAFGSFCVLIRR